MPLPEPLADGMPAAPSQDRPRRQSADETIREYAARCPAATDGEVTAALDGWDAAAYLSHWMRISDPEHDPSGEWAGGRHG